MNFLKYIIKDRCLIIFLLSFSGAVYAKAINQITLGNCSPAVANTAGNVQIFCGASAESIYWSTISDSEKISDFESYIVRYSDGEFIELARERIFALKNKYSNAWNYIETGWWHLNSFGPGAGEDRIKEQFKRAEDNFQKATTIYPDLDFANFSLGLIHYQNPYERDFEKAIKYFSQAIDLNPNFSKAFLFRGFSYAGLKEYKLACDDYLDFQSTNHYLSEEDFNYFLANRNFSTSFLEYHGCSIPDSHKLGRAIPPKQKVDCSRTIYLHEIEECARQGHEESMYTMGDRALVLPTEDDDTNDEINKKEAKKWFGKLIEKGNPLGFFGMGRLYWNGWGVKENCEKAYEYFTIAANAGVDEAQFNLGHMYLNNNCVKRSIRKARMWFAKAAAQGHPHAPYKIEFIDNCPKYPDHDLQPCHD